MVENRCSPITEQKLRKKFDVETVGARGLTYGEIKDSTIHFLNGYLLNQKGNLRIREARKVIQERVDNIDHRSRWSCTR